MATKEQTLIAALTNEVKAWREADLYCDILGYVAGECDCSAPNGVGEGHREVIRMAIAASDAAGIELKKVEGAK